MRIILNAEPKDSFHENEIPPREEMTSEEFEKRISRIYDVLKQPGTKVTWNDRIPDPDNPDQQRQVDITLVRKKKRTLVECRLHKRPQDVKWIEELFGRRASLRAHSIIGVSSSGFTEGAIRKARSLGVITRDFRYVTEEEVLSWGMSTKIALYHIKFSKTTLFPILSRVEIRQIREPVKFCKSDGTAWPLSDMFSSAADRLNKSAPTRETPVRLDKVRIQFFTQDLFVNNVPVRELILETKWKKVKVDVEVPVVHVYGEPPGVGLSQYEVRVEKFSDSDFEVYSSQTQVVPIVDFSLIPLIPGGIFKEMLIDFGRAVPIQGIGIVGQKEVKLSFFPFRVCPVREGSREHFVLTDAPFGLASLPRDLHSGL